MLKGLLIGTAAVAIIALLGINLYQNKFGPINPLPKSETTKEVTGSQRPERINTITTGLVVPWALDFLPSGDILFTERVGKVKLISDGQVTEIATIPVHSVSESGLHGIAVDPDFSSNDNIYIYYTYRTSGNNTLNRVVRYKLQDNRLTQERIIVDDIPGAPNHDGGRIKFGPDNFLYITTGDAQDPSRSQNRNSLAGKILRVDREGSPAPGNPFRTRIYSYGHRNPQGITWDSDGNLWSTEHGRSGILSGLDELNLIQAGRNYGWPEIEGNETRSDMVTPVVNSGSDDTWAPGGMAYLDGSIFFAGLRGRALYEYNITTKEFKVHLKGEFGRIREVVAGPDNLLYITTSNRDGRGDPISQDDRILQIDPTQL